MKKPEDYYGPSEMCVPFGYIDVTSIFSKGRHGIPGLDHPYYQLRSRIVKCLDQMAVVNCEEIADKILDVI